jgi:hypothetical protein
VAWASQLAAPYVGEVRKALREEKPALRSRLDPASSVEPTRAEKVLAAQTGEQLLGTDAAERVVDRRRRERLPVA